MLEGQARIARFRTHSEVEPRLASLNLRNMVPALGVRGDGDAQSAARAGAGVIAQGQLPSAEPEQVDLQNPHQQTTPPG